MDAVTNVMEQTAESRWTKLDSDRTSFLRRCEEYSQLTVPKICPPDGWNNNEALTHDYQSLGAQAVNHLSNKLMLALFAPSRPFFRLDATEALKKQLQRANITPDDFQNKLAEAEMEAVKELDRRSIRPKMYDAIKHIIITGNALLVFSKEMLRVLGVKNYVVKRDVEGGVLEMITREKVDVASLDKDIKTILGDKLRPDADNRVVLYKWVRRREDGDFEMDQWVDGEKLPEKFSGKWPEEKLPFRPITWDLASGADYGTGLVEDYAGDYAALSVMSKATIQAAILASEFRWLVNPAGMTKPEDLERSENGAALPGVNGDINLVQSGKGADLQININIAQVYINRIGQGFLLQSAVTRQAERVTKEEILRNADELENSLGGAYSRIAVDVQRPMAYWLMDLSGKKIVGSGIEPTIVTGLAALSRSGDRDNLMLFLQDLTVLGNLPPDLRARLRTSEIQASFASARGLSVQTYLLSEEEFAAQQQEDMRTDLMSQAVNRMPIGNEEGLAATQDMIDSTAMQAAASSNNIQE